MMVKNASALVTGAGRGIGRAISLDLGRAGAAVTLVARTRHELDAVADEVRAAGGRAHVHAGDIGDPAVCRAAVDAAMEAHGRLQILVHNAGIGVHASLS